MKYVTYEDFISGALMYFNNLDSLDIFLLIEKFEMETGLEVRKTGIKNNLGQYIRNDINSFIGLGPEYHMTKPLVGEEKPLREKFKEVVPSIIQAFFNQLDISSFYEMKKARYTSEKEKICKEANLLLISKDKEDVTSFEDKGFKNIDYYETESKFLESIKDNKDAIKKYHVVVNNITDLLLSEDTDPLFSKEYIEEEHVVETRIIKKGVYIYTALLDYGNKREWAARLANDKDWPTSNYTLTSELIANLIINRTLEFHQVDKEYDNKQALRKNNLNE